MSTVRELLQSKAGQIWSIPPNASVYRALELMAEKNIGALLVMVRISLKVASCFG